MIHRNKKKEAVVFDGFEGLDATSLLGKGGTDRLENFRILPDGSLQKREGCRHLGTLPHEVRAAIAAMDGGEEVLLFVSGDRLCRMRRSDGEMQSAAVFSAASGPALFLPTEDALYISDGEGLYRYEGGVTAAAGEAYIPTLGKGWMVNVDGAGEPYEAPNLLTRLGRYHYESGMSAYRLYFDRAVVEVVRITVGEDEIDGFTLAEDGRSVELSGLLSTADKPIRVLVRLTDPPLLLGAADAFLYRGREATRLFLYGASDPTRVYADAPMAETELWAGDGMSFPLYFRAADSFSVGQGRSVRAVLSMGERLLLLSEKALYLSPEAPTAAGMPDLVLLSEAVGCMPRNGAAVSDEKTLICVDGRGLARVTVDLGLKEECAVRRLTTPEDPPSDSRVLLTASGEVWLTAPQGRVFVYDPQRDRFTAFGGLRIDRLLDAYGHVVFVDGLHICQMDTACLVDETAEGECEIEGIFRSHYFDFGAPEADKRLSGLLMLCDLQGGPLSVRLLDDGTLADLVLEGEGTPDFSRLYERDLRSGRFRMAALELRAGGRARQRIYGAKIFV